MNGFRKMPAIVQYPEPLMKAQKKGLPEPESLGTIQTILSIISRRRNGSKPE
jgi:hypothetical protein